MTHCSSIISSEWLLIVIFFANFTINSSTDFGDNIYINIGVFGIASFTANLILTFIVERFRRLRIAKISFFFMFITIFSITVNFYQEEHPTGLLSSITPDRITIENRFDQMDNNFTHLKRNAHDLGIDIKLILNENTLKRKIKVKNNFRLWNGIILKYCSSFAFHMVSSGRNLDFFFIYLSCF